MKSYCPSLRCALSLIVCGVLVIGCESDNDEKPMTEEQAEAEVEDVSLFGTWKGIAGTGQVHVSLELKPFGRAGIGSDYDVAGSLTWPGSDAREVFGWYPNESTARLEVSGGNGWPDYDTWDLTIQGNTLTGIGRKGGGGTYAVRSWPMV